MIRVYRHVIISYRWQSIRRASTLALHGSKKGVYLAINNNPPSSSFINPSSTRPPLVFYQLIFI